MIQILMHLPHHGFTRQVDLARISELLADKRAILWLDVQDPTPEDVELLKKEFDFHELALEDAVRPHQRPKVEEYDHFYFLVFYSLQWKEKGAELQSTEIDLFVGENYLVAVHKGPVKEMDEGLQRWERNRENMEHGVGALVYSLLDSLVDNYFTVADQIAEQVTVLEGQVIGGADQGTVQGVFALKKCLLAMRRILGPERDVLAVLMRQDIPLLDRKTLVYLRDVYDHLVRITDTVDLHSDLLTSALDVHLSAVSNRLNQVVKTLTAWTIILMSLALIAGVYGMNFQNMPELDWAYGYLWALGLMLAVAVALYLYFKRRDWL